MTVFLILYLLVIVGALLVGITTFFTDKWFTPEQGVTAGYIIIAGGISFGPVMSLYMSSTS